MEKTLKPSQVFSWDKYQDLNGYDFYFEFTDNKLNRLNILNYFNTRMDEEYHYVGRILSLMLAYVYVDSQGNLVSMLHGRQLLQLGMNRVQRNDMLTYSIADLVNIHVLKSYHVKKRY